MKYIDKKLRRQSQIKLIDFAPSIDNYCGCGCGMALTGRKSRWATPECSNSAYSVFSIIKGNNSAIRKALFIKEEGFCKNCGLFDSEWEADHIIPVQNGGGGCDLSNFQTLCKDCHKEKTKNQMVSHRARISSQAAVSDAKIRLYALGAVPKFI